jgi:hypothetical protein
MQNEEQHTIRDNAPHQVTTTQGEEQCNTTNSNNGDGKEQMQNKKKNKKQNTMNINIKTTH